MLTFWVCGKSTKQLKKRKKQVFRTFPSVLLLVPVSKMLVLKSFALCNVLSYLLFLNWKHVSLQCKLRQETCLLNSPCCSVYQQQRVLEQRGKIPKTKQKTFCDLQSIIYSRCAVFPYFSVSHFSY